jgi:6-phosphogluconolactonase (cycloisomerase 2 family)
VNAGSNSISRFAVRHNGLELEATVSSGGVMPISLTVHDHLLYVLNAGGTPNITGFSTDHDGLTAIPSSTRPMGPGAASPAQISFDRDGHVLVITEKASSSIETGRYLYNLTDGLHRISGFAIGKDGSLTSAGFIGSLPVGAAGIAAS